MIWQAGAAVAVLLLSIIWLFVPRGSSPSRVVPPRVATANGVALTAWPIRAIVLTPAHGDSVTVPLSATAAIAWPAARAAASQAYWRSGSVWPLRLCVPSAMLANLTDVQLLGSGAAPDRAYTLLPDSALGARDLVLEPCQRGPDAPPARAGVLRETIAGAAHAVGESVALHGGTLALSALTLTGPGQDPTLPPEYARVTVRVQTALKPDWPVLAPTLLLPSGVAVLPSDITTSAQGAELSYLIPLPSEQLEVAWSIAPDADAPLIRWRATLDAPARRAAVLRDALEVRQVQASRGEAPGTTVVTINVANRSDEKLLLTSADLTLVANNRPLATPELASLRSPLKPGEQRTLVVNAPLAERETLILTVGVARYEIDAQGGG
jgi:hypothetical protein